MKQRICLAQALLHKPRLLILDEPTNGLDPAGIKELRDILKHLAHVENVAVLVSSHQLAEMEQMCDRVGIIDRGRLLGVKPIGELLAVAGGKEIYRFLTPQAGQAVEILETGYGGKLSACTANSFEIELVDEQVPLVNRYLVNSGIAIPRHQQGGRFARGRLHEHNGGEVFQLRKIIALYINEMLKFSKKISVLVILAIMTVGVIGIGAVLKISESAFVYVDDGSGNQSDEFEMIEMELADSREQLTLLDKQLESTDDPAEIDGLKSEKAYLTSHIELLQAALDYEIPINSSSDYRVQALYEAVDIKTALNALESIPEADRTAGQQAMILSHIARLTSLEAVVSGRDFRAYIDMRQQRDRGRQHSDRRRKTDQKKKVMSCGIRPIRPAAWMASSTAIRFNRRSAKSKPTSCPCGDNLDYTRGDSAVYPLTPAGRTQIADKAGRPLLPPGQRSWHQPGELQHQRNGLQNHAEFWSVHDRPFDDDPGRRRCLTGDCHRINQIFDHLACPPLENFHGQGPVAAEYGAGSRPLSLHPDHDHPGFPFRLCQRDTIRFFGQRQCR